MKKITIILISLCFGLTTSAQQVLNLNNNATTVLPVGAQKIAKADALAYVANKFENSEIVLNSISNVRDGQTYKVHDIIFCINSGNKTIKSGQLLKIKKSLEAMASQDTSFHASIKSFNSNDVLITNSVFAHIGTYSFFSFNKQNTKSITGILYYNLSDVNEANAVLKYILNHVQFIEE